MLKQQFRCKRCEAVHDASYWNETYENQVANNSDFVKIEEHHEDIHWYCPTCSWKFSGDKESVLVEPVMNIKEPISDVLNELMRESKELPEGFYTFFLVKFNPDDIKNTHRMEIVNKGDKLNKGYTKFEHKPDNSIVIIIRSYEDINYNYERIKYRLVWHIRKSLKEIKH